jgi:hypothetical protein
MPSALASSHRLARASQQPEASAASRARAVRSSQNRLKPSSSMYASTTGS